MAVVPPKEWPPLGQHKRGTPVTDLPEYPGLPTRGKTTVVIVPKRPRKQKAIESPDGSAEGSRSDPGSNPATP